MNLARQFYASAVLTSGKVLVLGGEYSGLNQPNSPTDTTGEIYNPVINTWSAGCQRPPAPWATSHAGAGRGKVLVGVPRARRTSRPI